MILIPNLRETPFHRIFVELSVEFDRLDEGEHEHFRTDGWVGAQMARVDGNRPITTATELFYDVEAELLRGALSLSYDDFAPSALWSDGPWESSEPREVAGCLSIFLGKTAETQLEADFRIERISIPPQSVVDSMIGLRAVAGEEQYLLSGAQFVVRGFAGDTISWYLTPGSMAKEVSGRVIRRYAARFVAESIGDAAHVAQARFNRFILSQSDVKAHAAS